MRALCLLAAFVLAAPAAAQSAPVSHVASAPAEGAPEALAHFAPLIGRWTISDWSRDENGDWQSGAGADWDFWYALDGWAVQDMWVAPGRDIPPEPGATRFIGTNLRMWDAGLDRWKMSWIFTASGEPQTWHASSTPGEIVMTLDPPDGGAATRRIRFYEMTGESFEWQMQVPVDGDGWQDVYRIHGDRRAVRD